MKLLSPLQNKDLKENQTVRELLRTQEVNKASEIARKNLAKAEADFQDTLARNLLKWEEEEEEHFKRVQEMKVEINGLEAKRLNSLIPLGILEEGVDDRMQDAVTFLANLRLREENAEDLTERLENKLDEVGQKDQDLKKKERQLLLREEGIERQTESTVLGAKRLSEEMTKITQMRSEATEELNEREKEVYLKERSNLSREESLKRTDKSLNDLAIQLAGERETLARAWDELKRKYPHGFKG